MAITLDPNFKGSSMTLSADRLTVHQTPGSTNFVRVTEGKRSGKWYWEYNWKSGPRVSIGIISSEVGVSYTNSAGDFCNEPTYSFPVGTGSGVVYFLKIYLKSRFRYLYQSKDDI